MLATDNFRMQLLGLDRIHVRTSNINRPMIDANQRSMLLSAQATLLLVILFACERLLVQVSSPLPERHMTR